MGADRGEGERGLAQPFDERVDVRAARQLAAPLRLVGALAVGAGWHAAAGTAGIGWGVFGYTSMLGAVRTH